MTNSLSKTLLLVINMIFGNMYRYFSNCYLPVHFTINK